MSRQRVPDSVCLIAGAGQTSRVTVTLVVWQVLQQGGFVAEVQIPAGLQHESKGFGEIDIISPVLPL